MPALGGGHALLKWVTSFPGNPAKGLPTVTGLVLLSNAETGQLEAVLDAAAVTALRTAAAAVIAVETLCRSGAASTAVVGCGVNGAETVRMFRALGTEVFVWTSTRHARKRSPSGSGAGGAVTRGGARVRRRRHGDTRQGGAVPGRVTARGPARVADGCGRPGKAEVAVGELERADLFCDDWEQASHGGELAAGVEAGVVTRKRVTEIGRVLTGEADGRRSAEDITLFDSTGLAIQDLAIAKVAAAKAGALDLVQLAL